MGYWNWSSVFLNFVAAFCFVARFGSTADEMAYSGFSRTVTLI